MSLFGPKYRVSRFVDHEIDDAVLTVTEPDTAKIERPLRRNIFPLYWIVAVLMLILLGGKVFSLTVLEGAKYQEASTRNSLRALVIPAPRGTIFDRFGKPLVYNVPSIDLVATASDLPTSEEERTALKERLMGFGIERSFLDQTFDSLPPKSIQAVPIKEQLTQEEALRFLGQREGFPGINLYKTTHREYIDSTIFAHLMGYEGKIKPEELKDNPDYLLTDSIGKQGIEKSYEKALRGQHGYQQAEVDSLGRVTRELGVINPVAGNDLILNIDMDLQKKIYDSLVVNLEKNSLKKAAAVAIDPRNGAVRAVVSLPSFDNNLFAKGITQDEYSTLSNDEARPLFNRALTGEYPPGSTIKPVVAAAALSEGIIDENQEIESRGGIQVGSFFFGDWKAHGFTDIRRAIAVSSDVYFYSVGGGYGGINGLGIERMKKYENLFGYGEYTGIDFPSEGNGFVPTPEWKKERIGERWYIGDDYNSSIGQGYITATPLQVVNSIATIANGGTLYEPRIGSQIKSQDGRVTSVENKIVRQGFIKPEIIKIVQEGMRETVTEGTAQPLKDLPVEVAGKTGTAQFGGDNKTHGWFVSYAPYSSPELALIVLIEGQGTEETYNAVPVTKEVYQWYFTREGEQ
jgi:penicillin-binding protein 2